MPRTKFPQRFRKQILALAASTSLLPLAVHALDLAESPPGTVEPYVRPNVIISVDDSGSMGWRLINNSSGTVREQPNADGSWPTNTERMSVLRYALRSIFDKSHPKYDSGLLPDGKIRLAWQIMHNNGNSSGAKSVDSGSGTTGVPSLNTNSMKVLEGQHRKNFLTFVGNMKASGGTPSHDMMRNADRYMRRPLSPNGPWSSNPGGTDDKSKEYLGCRRNYHIFMTDGRWNGTAHDVTSSSYRDNATNLTLPNGELYGSSGSVGGQTRLYRDGWNGSTIADWAFHSWANPLQSESNLEGSITPTVDYRKAPAEEDFGTSASPAKLLRFWNPRYNPAEWPHMVTYTIGFSNDAITWPGATDIVRPTDTLPFGYDGSFPDFIRGTRAWPQMNNENRRSLDLWHAALNGRGRFYAVEKGEDLEKAFRDIFGQINTATDPDFATSATSGSNVTRSDVGRYTAAYEPDQHWKGFIRSSKIKPNGDVESSWSGKSTAELLDAISLNNRLILTWSDERMSSGSEKGGAVFKWDGELSEEQKKLLKIDQTGNIDGLGKDRLDYIRGERGKEGNDPSYTASKPFRERSSRQGDIINSVVWYVGSPGGNYPMPGYTSFVRDNRDREPMLYVGGNDGMLHGFSAETGQEKIAYVPNGVIPKLRYLTQPSYDSNHRYFVDGSPMTGDVDLNSSNPATAVPDWRTVLVGTLGLGGKGYFLLDVTNPDFSQDPEQLVLLDRTRSELEGERDCSALSGAAMALCVKDRDIDADIGHITAQPVVDDADPMRTTQITRMNNGRWAVVLGNGYNSLNQRPVLLVQYLDGERELVRIQATNDTKGTGHANDNGLAAPRLIDLNGDGLVDVVYAGDNLGNMWKFDLTSTDETKWEVAFSGSPLFTARGPASLGSSNREKVQSIAVPPIVRANDRLAKAGDGTLYRVGGMMVSFGTGRNVTTNDPEANEVQTIYSVLDNTRYELLSTGKLKTYKVASGTCSPVPQANCIPAPKALGEGVTMAKLAQQKITEVGEAGKVEPVVELDRETWGQGYNGWYLDLPAVGERLLKPMSFYDGSNILVLNTQVPAKGSDADPNVESCETVAVDEERQWMTLINVMDGKKPSIQLIDYNNDGLYDAADQAISRAPISKGTSSIVTGLVPREEGADDDEEVCAEGDAECEERRRKRDADCVNFVINAKNSVELKLACMPEETKRPSWRQLH